MTFCPLEQKISESDYQITKYKSLEKTSATPGGSIRPITFSYQNQINIAKGERSFNKNIINAGIIANQ